MRHPGRLVSVVALALSVGFLSAQPPGPFGFGGPIERSADFVLLANKAILAELKLDDAQVAKLTKLPDAVRAELKDELATARKKVKDSKAVVDALHERIRKAVGK